MWQDLLAAIALMLVLEGMLPFLYPMAWRRMLLQVIHMTDGALRIMGLGGMLLGLLLLYLVR
jgi:uncharacterized protein